MDILRQNKKIIIGILGVIVLFVVYVLLKPDAKGGAPIVSSSSTAGDEPEVSRDILALLVDLKSIKIDRTFFETPALRTLQDFSVPLVEEPRGRANPFAPVGVGGAHTSTTTTTTTTTKKTPLHGSF